MKKIVIFILLLSAGCATIPTPPHHAYPFRASYSAQGTVDGKDIFFDGALSIISSSMGIIEIYGPSGLTLYALNINKNSIEVLDTWGRPQQTFSLPCENALGLIAGLPPEHPYIYRKTSGDIIKIKYLWGYVTLDRDMKPSTLHLKLEKKPIDIVFLPHEKGLTLLVTSGHDKLSIEFAIKAGGRWS